MTASLDTHMTDDTLRNALLLDFAVASVELTRARRQQRGKDTPEHRAAVEAAQDGVDAVLDMYLDTRGRSSGDR